MLLLYLVHMDRILISSG